jgi:hypothetical protein
MWDCGDSEPIVIYSQPELRTHGFNGQRRTHDLPLQPVAHAWRRCSQRRTLGLLLQCRFGLQATTRLTNCSPVLS